MALPYYGFTLLYDSFGISCYIALSHYVELLSYVYIYSYVYIAFAHIIMLLSYYCRATFTLFYHCD